VKKQLFRATLETEHFIVQLLCENHVPQEFFDAHNETVTQHTIVDFPLSLEDEERSVTKKIRNIELNVGLYFVIRCRKTNLFVGCVDVCPSYESLLLNSWTTKSHWNKECVTEILTKMIHLCKEVLPSHRIRVQVPCGEVFFTTILTKVFSAQKGSYKLVHFTNDGTGVEYHEFFIE